MWTALKFIYVIYDNCTIPIENGVVRKIRERENERENNPSMSLPRYILHVPFDMNLYLFQLFKKNRLWGLSSY